MRPKTNLEFHSDLVSVGSVEAPSNPSFPWAAVPGGREVLTAPEGAYISQSWDVPLPSPRAERRFQFSVSTILLHSR
jgi:hypothetical protein